MMDSDNTTALKDKSAETASASASSSDSSMTGKYYALLVAMLVLLSALGSLWIVFAGVMCEAVALWTIHSLVVYEIFMIMTVFGLGMIFTTANTLAMNEGWHSLYLGAPKFLPAPPHP